MSEVGFSRQAREAMQAFAAAFADGDALDLAEAELLIDALDPAEAWAVRRGIHTVMNDDAQSC